MVRRFLQKGTNDSNLRRDLQGFLRQKYVLTMASKYRCYLRGSGASGFYVHALCLRLLWDACAFIRLLSSLEVNTQPRRINKRESE